MKKLEDIPKDELFKVPDDYFDDLPSKVQTRIASLKQENEPSLFFRFKLQYIVPFIFLMAIGFIWLDSLNHNSDTEALLASVDTDQLITYLDDSDMSTDEILETMDASDLVEIEEQAYGLNLQIEDVKAFEELDNENL